MVSSIVLVHGLGVLGMMVNAKLDLTEAFLADLAFYPGDIIKNILAVIIAVALHKAFPDLLVRRVNAGTPQKPEPHEHHPSGGSRFG